MKGDFWISVFLFIIFAFSVPSDLSAVEVRQFGNVDGMGGVNLADAVFSLRIVVGQPPTGTPKMENEVNGDAKIGIEEAVYALQCTSGLRSPDMIVNGIIEDADYGFLADEQEDGAGLLGGSVRILNGNAAVRRKDLSFPSPHGMGLGFEAVYNSRPIRLSTSGFGWTHTYDVYLDPAFDLGGLQAVKIVDETGRSAFFRETANGGYDGLFYERTRLQFTGGTYIWHRRNGRKYVFSNSGRLDWIADDFGNRLNLQYDPQNRLASVTDAASGRLLNFHYNGTGMLDYIAGPVTTSVPDGIWVRYVYDGDRNPSQVVYADNSGFQYGYTDSADSHNLTELRDQENHLVNTWGYDDQDRCISFFSREGQGFSIAYSASDSVQVTDTYGVTRAYTLADWTQGRRRITSAQGKPGASYRATDIVRWDYDDRMRLVETESSRGGITRHEDFDEYDRPRKLVLAAGTSEERILFRVWHPDKDVLLSQNEKSVLGLGDKQTIFDFDNEGDTVFNENPTARMYRLVEKGFTADISGNILPYTYITEMTYSGRGQIETLNGPLNGVLDTTAFSYDATTGNLISMNLPLAGPVDYTQYNPAGSPMSMTDPNGNQIDFDYDGRGRLTKQHFHSNGGIQALTYGLSGEPELLTDADGITRAYSYDPDYGRISRITDHQGNFITYGYDSAGNPDLMAYHDPQGNRSRLKQWSFQHPEVPGRPWKRIQPDGTFTELDYDNSGNLTKITDPQGDTAEFSYDLLNQMVSETQPGNVITTYHYDHHGNLIRVVDPENRSTTYQYDDMGRQISVHSPDTGTTRFAYDAASNLKQKTDARQITVSYDYDSLNRLVSENYPAFADRPAYSIAYDFGSYIAPQMTGGKGRLTRMVDPSGSTVFDYTDFDSEGIIRKITSIAGQAFTTVQEYSPGGRILSILHPFGRKIDYNRSECMCQISAVATDDSTTVTTIADNFEYRPFGALRAMRLGNMGQIDSLFKDSGRITTVGTGEPKQRTYDYYDDGTLQAITAGNLPWQNQNFDYDSLNRLTGAVGMYGSHTFFYDNVGNRSQMTHDGLVTDYTYFTGTNRLQQVSPEWKDPVVYEYDSAGNTIGIGDRQFEYNQQNRLIRTEEGSKEAEYVYNGFGQRIIKKVGSAAQGYITTFYHYDIEGHLIGESPGDGGFDSGVSYIFRGENRLAKIDESTGEIYYFHHDAVGMPQYLTDSANQVVWEGIWQKPFGEVAVNPNASIENNIRFAGQYFDAETGLHYNWFRYYDPKTGRYLTPDPIGLDGGINLYAYVISNPINKFDPNGLWTIGVDISGSAAALFGLTGGVTFAIDGELNIAAIPHGGGMYLVGASASIAVQTQYTSAKIIYDLEKYATATGGSAGYMVGVTGEYIEGNGYKGFAIGRYAGPGLWPISLHRQAEYAWVFGTNLMNADCAE